MVRLKRMPRDIGRYLLPRGLAVLGWAAASVGIGVAALWASDDFAQRFATALALGGAIGEVVLGLMAYSLRSCASDADYDQRRVRIARGRYTLGLLLAGSVLGAGCYGIVDSPNIDNSLKVVSVYLAVMAAAKIVHSEHYRLTKLEHAHGMTRYSPAIAWIDTVWSRIVLSAGVLVGAWLLLSPVDTVFTFLLAFLLAAFALGALRWAVEDDVNPPAAAAGS